MDYKEVTDTDDKLVSLLGIIMPSSLIHSYSLLIFTDLWYH
jgi:hypothetical protein